MSIIYLFSITIIYCQILEIEISKLSDHMRFVSRILLSGEWVHFWVQFAVLDKYVAAARMGCPLLVRRDEILLWGPLLDTW